jgi:excisionase family DNA binding protein
MEHSEISSRLLSYKEVMSALGIGRSKTSEIVLAGELPSIKIGRRRLIPESGVRQYIADHMAGNA